MNGTNNSSLFVLYQSEGSGDTSGDESGDGTKDGVLHIKVNYALFLTLCL